MKSKDENSPQEDEEPRKVQVVITNKHLKIGGATVCCIAGLIITLVNMRSDVDMSLIGAGLMFTALGMLVKSGLIDD